MSKYSDGLYYSAGKAKSYPFKLLICMGQRERGKSTDWLRDEIDHALKTGEKFIWMRRYPVEIWGDKRTKGCAEGFGGSLARIHGDKYADIKVTKRGKITVGDKHVGSFMTLSSAPKSIGDGEYTHLVFDEFLIDKKNYHYIGGWREPEELLKVMDTLFRGVTPRGEDLKSVFRVVLCANTVSFYNPYTAYFNIPEYNGEFYWDKTRKILVQCDYSDAMARKRAESPFGQLIEGTPYAGYATYNKWLNNHSEFIKPLPNRSELRYNISAGGYLLGVYTHNGEFYIAESRDKTRYTIALTRGDRTVNSVLLHQNRRGQLRYLIDAYNHSEIWYDNEKVATEFEKLAVYLS